ncbi:hypothetical protein IP92_02858 [Pseudoduganella flava]|uniref:Uncharacterized protein n=1 Tax=Pseudoduganella flava TaxID=871742 RepID=A0A562PQ09_9BURK|nr:hypothetical protein [Pseudoduganella flava]QGZ37701.1 hypothetical protein GO485_00585 [Pseudoduganella flava]TWI46499.1 hypothetical protein IP92_02858 [Pseudoduganella flava]
MATLDNRSTRFTPAQQPHQQQNQQQTRHQRILQTIRGASLRRITASAALLAAVGLTFVLVG